MEDVPSVDTLLAEMAGAGQGAWSRGDDSAYAPPAPPRGARPPALRYSHLAMVDMLVQNPWMSQNELAAAFGRTPAWISTIVTSDAFKQRLEERRDEVVDPEIRLTLKERFEALTVRSLQKLQERLEHQPSDGLLLKAADLGAKALGIGGNAPTPVLITSEERLASLANRLKALQNGTGARFGGPEVVDVDSREVPNG